MYGEPATVAGMPHQPPPLPLRAISGYAPGVNIRLIFAA